MLRQARAACDILNAVSITWAYFLLRNVDVQLRVALEMKAQAEDKSLQEVIRGALCEHYALECPEMKGRRREDTWTNARTIYLKMWPELFDAVKQDAADTGESMRSLILQALETRYVTEAA